MFGVLGVGVLGLKESLEFLFPRSISILVFQGCWRQVGRTLMLSRDLIGLLAARRTLIPYWVLSS